MFTGIDLYSVEGTTFVSSAFGVWMVVLGIVGILATVILGFAGVPGLIERRRRPWFAIAAVLAAGLTVLPVSQWSSPDMRATATRHDSWVIATGTIGWSDIREDKYGEIPEILIRLTTPDAWLLSFTEPDDIDKLVGRDGDIRAECRPAGENRLSCTTDITAGPVQPKHFLQAIVGGDSEIIEWGEPVVSPLPAP